MALFRTKICLKALLAATALGIGLPAAVAAEEEKPPQQLGEETADKLNNDYRQASDAKDWNKALAIVDGQLAKVPPESYDAVMLNQIKAQTYFQKNEMSPALAALERSLAIDDRHQYFVEKTRQETLYLVAQLNFQEGASSKDPKKQAAFYAKSDQALDRWIKNNKDFTTENLYFVAVLYFSRGMPASETPGVEAKSDAALLEKALYWTNRGLSASARPRDTFYQLKLAELYQLNRITETTDLLELLVKMKPENKSYWQQLAAQYLQLAATVEKTDDAGKKTDDAGKKTDDAGKKKDDAGKKDEKAFLAYNIRAILAIERAQKLGIMTTPKDNYNLVGIYFNIGQFAEACRLLEQGLKENSIERTQPNYELLANSYQQLHREPKAIEALQAAAKIFPQSGQIEYEIAQVNFTIDKFKEAFEHMKICEAKGGTDRPHIGWLFYAYLALDLKQYDEALKGAEQAAKYPEAKEEAQKMQEAIKATIQDRESRLNIQ